MLLPINFRKILNTVYRNGQSSQTNINAVSPVSIDKTTPTDRVNAPGFAQMFENFIKGVDQKKKISKKETQDLILGRSDNIHEAVVKNHRKQELHLT